MPAGKKTNRKVSFSGITEIKMIDRLPKYVKFRINPQDEFQRDKDLKRDKSRTIPELFLEMLIAQSKKQAKAGATSKLKAERVSAWHSENGGSSSKFEVKKCVAVTPVQPLNLANTKLGKRRQERRARAQQLQSLKLPSPN
tara:strand:+ start:390 stop:812 length:423 start_codon:yes stop_codon:yes gene_type:complete